MTTDDSDKNFVEKKNLSERQTIDSESEEDNTLCKLTYKKKILILFKFLDK